MDKIFKIPFDCGFGVYEITRTSNKILTIRYISDQKTSNIETLMKLANLSYPSHLIKCFEELSEYFQGTLQTFQSKDFLHLEGTEFQKKVWRKMTEIPFGITISYSELASLVENPKAVRSIGSICGKNPCEILIPCHRIVGKESVGGFRNGVEMKKTLLDFEKKTILCEKEI